MTDGNLAGPGLCLGFQGGRKGQDRERTWTTAGETGADVKAGELDGHRWSRGPGNYREADEDSSGERRLECYSCRAVWGGWLW